jgi:putative hydrolase of HD superfamily
MQTETPITQWSDEQILETARQLRVAYQLKHTLRYHTQRDLSIHSESVAEHIFALLFLAQYFLPIEDKANTLNRERLYQILLFHDFPEIPHGDIPYIFKTKADEERERKAAEGVFASLPLSLQKLSLNSWQEYEDRQTPEAHFAYALDKTEPVFELWDPVNEHTPERLKQTWESHIEKKRRATEHFPIMRRFVEVVSEDMLKRGVFLK